MFCYVLLKYLLKLSLAISQDIGHVTIKAKKSQA